LANGSWVKENKKGRKKEVFVVHKNRLGRHPFLSEREKIKRKGRKKMGGTRGPVEE